MFNKPFRIKSNVPLRSSDRKRLQNQVKQLYANEKNDELLSNCFTNKEEINILKIQVHKGKVVTVYQFQKEPLFFEADHHFCPTVAAIWALHIDVPLLTTHLPVISKLANGADLMLPGIILPTSSGQWSHFDKGGIVGVNTTENLACFSIGVALMSSENMLVCQERHGKAVQILHNFGDHLWGLGEKISPPIIKPALFELPTDDTTEANLSETENVGAEQEEFKNELEESSNKMQELQLDCKLETEEIVDKIDDAISQETCDQKSDVELMDELLEQCFLTALKTKLKDKDLPILASTFYRNHVLPICPQDKFLDIKKTTYKKFGKYLKHLTEVGLIGVKELSKGNDNIVTVNRSHDLYRSFKVLQSIEEETPVANTESYCGVITSKAYEAPEIVMVYGISHSTKELFKTIGVEKGTFLMPGDVRQLVTTYVKDNNLTNGKMVTLDPLLHDAICNKREENVVEVTWDHLFKTLLSNMQVNHKIMFKGIDPIIKKGQPPMINIATQVRTGNKKVTLVKNLESFYINPQEFADVIRKQAQASTSLSVVPGSNPKNPAQQVMIQGNQVNYVESILTGHRYRLPAKFITGLENAPKKKGKGKR